MFRSAVICNFFSQLTAELEYNKELQLFCLPKDTGLNINGSRLLMTRKEITMLLECIFSVVELHIFLIMVQVHVGVLI